MSEKKKAPAKKTRRPLGSLMSAEQVTRPDGSTVDITGGVFVLDTVGVFVVDGKEIEVG